MTHTTRMRLRQAWNVAFFILAAGCLLLPVLMLVACAGASTSEITPAESSAAQKSYRLTGESQKKHKTRIVFRKIDADAVGDSSEEK